MANLDTYKVFYIRNFVDLQYSYWIYLLLVLLKQIYHVRSFSDTSSRLTNFQFKFSYNLHFCIVFRSLLLIDTPGVACYLKAFNLVNLELQCHLLMIGGYYTVQYTKSCSCVL